MNIFITGVTGFVGTSLVNHFKTKPNAKAYGHSRDPERATGKFAGASVSIQSEYTSALSDSLNINSVIHLAGLAHDLSNQYTSGDYEKVNVANTCRVFDEFLNSKASKFIFISSIKAVVDIADVAVDESVVPNPVSVYGKSKLKAEQYIQSRELPAGKFVYILRPAMIHGPGNKGNLNLLYTFVKSGIPWPLGSYHNQRSFLSIDNFNFVVEFLVRENARSGIYHLADSGFLSTTELVKQIARALDRNVPVWNLPTWLIHSAARIAGQQARLNKLTENMMVSNKKILSVLGQPLPATLQEGITKTILSFMS